MHIKYNFCDLIYNPQRHYFFSSFALQLLSIVSPTNPEKPLMLLPKFSRHSALWGFTCHFHFISPISLNLTSKTGKDPRGFQFPPISACQMLRDSHRHPSLWALLIHPCYPLPLNMTVFLLRHSCEGFVVSCSPHHNFKF